jgi:hypothetical protein
LYENNGAVTRTTIDSALSPEFKFLRENILFPLLAASALTVMTAADFGSSGSQQLLMARSCDEPHVSITGNFSVTGRHINFKCVKVPRCPSRACFSRIAAYLQVTQFPQTRVICRQCPHPAVQAFVCDVTEHRSFLGYRPVAVTNFKHFLRELRVFTKHFVRAVGLPARNQADDIQKTKQDFQVTA